MQRRQTVLFEDSLRDEDHTYAGNVSSTFSISPNVSDILASDSPSSSEKNTSLGKRPHPVDNDRRSCRHSLMPVFKEFFVSHATLLDQTVEMTLNENSPQRTPAPLTDLSGFSMMANASAGSHSTWSPAPNKETRSVIQGKPSKVDQLQCQSHVVSLFF